jgi:zinc/manganese transport system ATP-binding protein
MTPGRLHWAADENHSQNMAVVISEATPRDVVGAAGRPDAGGMALALEGATVRLGDREIWRDVSLSVESGHFVAVLGPNGAGKSTLIRVLLGLVPLSAGSARILGRPPGQRNRRIGYLPQRRSFDRDLRIRARDVVRLGGDGMRWGTRLPLLDRLLPSGQGRALEARIDEVAALVGADGYIDRPVGELSGGEQQRILIAQALVSGPELLLLDEPLDSLDLANQHAVSALVQRISREQGVTVLLVCHDVNPVLPYLDRVLYVAAGRALIGPPEEVVRTETLTRLYGTRVEVLRTGDGRVVVVGQPDAPGCRGVH